MASMIPLVLHLDGPRRGADNMRLDAAALANVADGAPGSIRIYGFSPPCLTLGRLQPATDVDYDACRRDGVDVVRRATGGRAVLHDAEVTYCVACRIDDPDLGGDVLTACARIHAAVGRGLARLGVATHPVAHRTEPSAARRTAAAIADCFTRPASHELVDAEGLKLVGSAQARRGVALMQHGSILLEPPRAATYLTVAAASDGPKAATRGVSAWMRRHVSPEEVSVHLADGFRESLGPRLATSGVVESAVG